MPYESKFVVGRGFDPYRNLAVEELLLDEVHPDQTILYLWQNQRTVVIGRNQNAYRECHIEALETDGGHLARRLSGGGAVYHDLGNLNFTFLVTKEQYDLHRQMDVILKAAKAMGIDAQFSGRNDVQVNGRKFSGNAFYHGKHSSFHHGTLLVDADMSVMQKYLNVSVQKMESKGVDSVRSRVINLCQLVPSLTVQDAKDAMHRAFVAEYGRCSAAIEPEDLFEKSKIESIEEKYQSHAWRIGKNPPFDVSIETRFAWGGVELGFVIEGGTIRMAKAFSDALDADLIERIAQCFIGINYDRKQMVEALLNLCAAEENAAVAQLAQWIKTA